MSRGVTLANVAASASSTTLFAAHEAVSARTIWNDSTSVLYVRLDGGTASATACSVKIPADGYYELPKPTADGVITGLWASATGTARTTEVV